MTDHIVPQSLYGRPLCQGITLHASWLVSRYWPHLAAGMQALPKCMLPEQVCMRQRHACRVLICGARVPGAEGLQLSKKDEQLDLLAQVLAAGAEDAAEEADDNTDGVAQRPAARRVVSNLASMSGTA